MLSSPTAVGALVIRRRANSQGFSWLVRSSAAAEGRAGRALLSIYLPLILAVSGALARKIAERAAFSADPRRWSQRNIGQNGRTQPDRMRGSVPAVIDVQAVPGLAALATTPMPSSRRASANVHRILRSL